MNFIAAGECIQGFIYHNCHAKCGISLLINKAPNSVKQSCLPTIGLTDLIGEVTATLPEASIEHNTAPPTGDSGIELDQMSSSVAAKEPQPMPKLPRDDSTLDLRKTSKRTHRRSLSSDFFRGSKSKPVVTCVHRTNPCGRTCGHRRALSSDFRIDKVVNVEELTEKPKKQIKSVLFSHRRNASNTSQISHGKVSDQSSLIRDFDSSQRFLVIILDF